MSALAAAISAQLSAETRTRLRSPVTIVTILAFFAVAFLYIPDPAAHRVSISWERDGLLMSGKYTSSYIGWVVAMLTSLLMPFAGFYLVTGSVRRDLERKIWPIVAATPTSRSAYLLGKFFASFAYLLLLGAVGLMPAVFLFVRYGDGPFQPMQILLPWLLVVPGAMAFVAAMALLFDVTPGLRGRAGHVLWFFAWLFIFLMLPMAISGRMDSDPSNDRIPVFDPAGMAMIHDVISNAIGGAPRALSMGIRVTEENIHRVDFPAIHPDGASIIRRVLELAWPVAPLALARLIFPFGVARSLRSGAKPRKEKRTRAESTPWSSTEGRFPIAAGRVEPRPGAFRSVVADAALIWQSASWIKWPLAALALGAAVAGQASSGLTAAYLLVLAVVISEAAAREELAGTGPLVFAQPGMPLSIVAWKAASIALFVFTVSVPPLAAQAMRGGPHAAAFALSLVFVSLFAASAGWLTRGGKLFSAVFAVLWYIAIQGNSGLDFTGAFAKTANLTLSAGFAGAAAVLMAVALVVERLRRA